MENEKKIIQHVLKKLDEGDNAVLTVEMEILLKVLDKVPSYCRDEVIAAFCKEEEEC